MPTAESVWKTREFVNRNPRSQKKRSMKHVKNTKPSSSASGRWWWDGCQNCQQWLACFETRIGDQEAHLRNWSMFSTLRSSTSSYGRQQWCLTSLDEDEIERQIYWLMHGYHRSFRGIWAYSPHSVCPDSAGRRFSSNDFSDTAHTRLVRLTAAPEYQPLEL